jgi:hypothetical protein
MTRHEALTALLAKVEAGLDTEHHHAAAFPSESAYGHCTWHDSHSASSGSLDAAKALHEATLPEWLWSAGQGATACSWSVLSHREGVRRDCTSDTPALAWLIAILKALIAMEETQ